jgi:Maltogenic Amylase, C-terminal domain
MSEFYRKLFGLKRENTALWNAKWGARMINVPNSIPNKVLSFVRRNERDKVFAMFNFSKSAQTPDFGETLYHGKYRDFFSGEAVEFPNSLQLSLPAWGYRIFVK